MTTHQAIRLPIGSHVVFVMDETGVCTMNVGDGIAELGGKPGDLVGRNLFEVYTDPIAQAQLTRALTGESFTAEREFAGRTIWVSYNPLHDEAGRFSGSVGVTTDVTAQRATEDQLATARDRSRRLVDLSAALTREALDPDALLGITARTLTDVAGDLCAIWLTGRHPDRLELRAVWPPERPENALRPATLDLDAWVSATQAHPYTEQGRSGVRLPLRSRGALVGAVDVCRAEHQGGMDEDEVSLLAEITERCALALDNALLLQIQRETHQERVKFQALADASNNLIAIADTEGNPAYLNPRLRDLGLKVASGPDLWAGLRGLPDMSKRTEMRRSMETIGRWSGDVEVTVADRPMTLHGDLFRLAHPDTGRALGVAWIAEDVTEQRSTEAALRRSNADMRQFKALVEASPDFIAIAGLDGTVRYVNPGGRRLIGMAADLDVTRTTIADYLTPEGLTASVEVEQPAVVANGHWEGESTLRHHGGGPPIPVVIASFLMRDSETGEPFALATVQRDITERLEAENNQRRLAEQRQGLLSRLVNAQEAERTEIAADVHDDPVQALAAVELRLGLLRRNLGERTPDVMDNLTDLQRSVSGATDRLRALLFDLEPPDLQNGLAAALGRAAEEVFAGTAVRWQVVCDSEPPASEATRSVAYRIAKEALTNARKHAEAQHVVVSLRERAEGVEVTVADDGKGLGAGPPRSSRGHRGLFSMRDRATAAGGEWTLENRPGGGAQMRVWLPH